MHRGLHSLCGESVENLILPAHRPVTVPGYFLKINYKLRSITRLKTHKQLIYENARFSVFFGFSIISN